jgi:hypothetical protein
VSGVEADDASGGLRKDNFLAARVGEADFGGRGSRSGFGESGGEEEDHGKDEEKEFFHGRKPLFRWE